MAISWTAAGATALSASPKTPETLTKAANLGAFGTVALIVLVGLAVIALLAMLIGWVSVLADYQVQSRPVRTVVWVVVVLCLPVLGTALWAMIGRRNRAVQPREITAPRTTVSPSKQVISSGIVGLQRTV